jgi:putative transferase (TIGR04331 family)
MKNLLILSNNLKQQNIEKNFNLVFAGSGLRETIKSYNNKKEFIIINKIYDKYKISQKSIEYENYFNQILKVLTLSLNNFHNTNFSERYWSFLVSPWLTFFLRFIFDKWIRLEKVKNTIEIDSMIALKEDGSHYKNFCPINCSNIHKLNNNKNWHYFIDKILAKNFFKDIVFLELDESKIKKNKVNRNYEKSLKKKFFNFTKKNKFFFYHNDFSKFNLSLLNLKLYQFANISSLNLCEDNNYDYNLRLNFKTLYEKKNDNFLDFIIDEIKFHIPVSLIENYSHNVSLVNNSIWPEQPKIIVSTKGIWSSDSFSFYLGEKTEKFSSKLYYIQHGAEYGTSKFFFSENLEINLSDKFFSWGWKNSEKIQPIGIIKNLKMFKKPSLLKKILFITRLQKFKFNFHHGHFYDESWISYITSNIKFIKALRKNNYNEEIVLRLKKTGNFNYDQKSYHKLNNVIIDSGNKNLNLYKNKYFFIFSYNSSVFYEYLSQNIPCMCLIDNSYEFNQQALKYINLLKDLNIVCDNPEELATKYLSNMKNFDDWWNSEKNFNQRKVFCENYAKREKNIFNHFLNYFFE